MLCLFMFMCYPCPHQSIKNGVITGAVITSGGGFSTYWPTPAWQKTHVTKYFKSLSTAPAAGYNPGGRGYPDVSFLGVTYNVYTAGELFLTFGTSASAPLFAAMSE
jgi:tripeptidyl-peptidase-1